MKGKQNIVVGLDIGTSKTCCIVGERTESGVDIVGIGSFPSKGLKKGVVINIDATVSSIRKAVEEAELMAGCEINSVYAGIAGSHIKSLNSHGIVAIKDKEVADQDIVRVLDAAQAVAIPMDREVIHIIPQEYIIDDQDGIREPRGMSGVRLAAKVHVVTGAVTSAQNIIKCCHQTGLTVQDIVLQPLASSEAVLTSDEKELGVLLVDMGGGTTDIAVYRNGSVQHTAVLSLGGDHVTRDIAIGLGTPTTDAERIKRRYGHATASAIEEGEMVEVPSVGGRQARQVPRRMLAEIISPRVAEIFNLVNRELERASMRERLPAGVVLTGGGVLLPGVIDVAEKVFGMQVRKGVPSGVRGLTDGVDSPMYSTGVGLVLFGLDRKQQAAKRTKSEKSDGFFTRMRSRFSEWFGSAF